jgi:solute carrier family 25 protein 44
MSFSVAGMEEERCAAAAADEIQRLPAEVNWEMLVLGAPLFPGVSAVLYPAIVV